MRSGYCYKLHKNLNINLLGDLPLRNLKRGADTMDIPRKVGIVVFSAVPAIIGGGIVFAVTHDYTAMWVYQVLLLFGVGAFVAR